LDDDLFRSNDLSGSFSHCEPAKQSQDWVVQNRCHPLVDQSTSYLQRPGGLERNGLESKPVIESAVWGLPGWWRYRRGEPPSATLGTGLARPSHSLSADPNIWSKRDDNWQQSGDFLSTELAAEPTAPTNTSHLSCHCEEPGLPGDAAI